MPGEQAAGGVRRPGGSPKHRAAGQGKVVQAAPRARRAKVAPRRGGARVLRTVLTPSRAVVPATTAEDLRAKWATDRDEGLAVPPDGCPARRASGLF